MAFIAHHLQASRPSRGSDCAPITGPTTCIRRDQAEPTSARRLTSHGGHALPIGLLRARALPHPTTHRIRLLHARLVRGRMRRRRIAIRLPADGRRGRSVAVPLRQSLQYVGLLDANPSGRQMRRPAASGLCVVELRARRLVCRHAAQEGLLRGGGSAREMEGRQQRDLTLGHRAVELPIRLARPRHVE